MYSVYNFLILISLLPIATLAHNGYFRESYSLAHNDFALDLYQTLREEDDGNTNTFLSPFSIYTALAMVRLAASGSTCDQISAFMNWIEFESIDKSNSGHMAFRNFTMANKDSSLKGAFTLANKLYFQKHFDNSFMRNRFLPRLRKFYDTEVAMLNFAADPDGSRRSINSWVEQKTNNRIRELLKPGMLSRLTRFVLINAMHMKLPWKTSFNKNKTLPMPFFYQEGSFKAVNMMAVKSEFKYTENDRYKAVSLPYQGDFAMIVVVPKEGKSLADVEDVLSAGVFRSLLGQMKDEEVDIRIPKFTIESHFHLMKQLRKLGIKEAFDPSVADFSWILGIKGFFLSDIVHKTFIDVDEEGMEAAAVTAGVRNFNQNDSDKFLVANRPFIFAIINSKTDTILFFGKVANPIQK